MNTATPLAMIAVIVITMTISISVTPRWRARGLRQRIGRIAHSVAMQNHGGVGRSRYGDRDAQRVGVGNGVEHLFRHGNASPVRLEPRYGIAIEITDCRDRAGG